MATLQGTKIKDTYPGILKFTDNAGVAGSPKDITDGAGSGLPIAMSSDRINFTDTIDFTNATISGTSEGIGSEQNADNIIIYSNDVNGSPSTVQVVAGTGITLTNNFDGNFTIDAAGGAAGLINGTGIESIQQADFLTPTLPANANGQYSVALGFNAQATGLYATALGGSSRVDSQLSIAIGPGSVVTDEKSVGIGHNAYALGLQSVGIADSVYVNSDKSVIIGQGSRINETTATQNIIIGKGVTNNNTNADCIVVGNDFTIPSGNSQSAVYIGNGLSLSGSNYNGVFIGLANTISNANNSAVIGRTNNLNNATYASVLGTDNNVTAGNSAAVGKGNTVSAGGAVAIGTSITAAKANTVSMNELEIVTAGNGVILTSPNGTQYKLTVSDTGDIVSTAI